MASSMGIPIWVEFFPVSIRRVSASTTINGVNSQGQLSRLCHYRRQRCRVCGYSYTGARKLGAARNLWHRTHTCSNISTARSSGTVSRDSNSCRTGLSIEFCLVSAASPVAAGGVRAATTTELTPFTIPAPAAANLPPQTLSVSTPQFNATLGTLVSATTTISGTVDAAAEFFIPVPADPTISL